MQFEVGAHVKKNPVTWIPNEFDGWGRGDGIGQVVEPPFALDDDSVDVRWPAGRCFELVNQLLRADRPETL